MNMSEEELQRLLRLKRYEKPPAGYEERFLQEFQQRQRAEIVHRPLLEIAWDRIGSLFPEFRVPAYAYGVIGLFAVAISAWILTTEEITAPIASQTQPVQAPANPPAVSSFSLHQSEAPQAVPRPVDIPRARHVGAQPAHYELRTAPPKQFHEPYSF